MVNLNTARESINTARQQIQENRTKAQEAKQELQKRKEQLPNIRTQQALRGQKYGKGLQGRALRQKVISAEKDIDSRKGIISDYEKELQNYEQDVGAYEEKVKSAEKAQARYNKEKSEWKLARKLIVEGKTLAARDSPSLRKKIQQLRSSGLQTPAEHELQKETEQILQTAIDDVNLRGKSVEEAFKGLNLDYLQKTGRIKIEEVSKDFPEIEAPRGADLNIQKDFKEIKTDKNKLNFSGELFSLVSASSTEQNGSSILTGNSIRNSMDSSSEIRTGDSFVNRIVNRVKEVFEGQRIKGAGPPITNITTPSGVFVSAYPTGTGATALIYPLSIEQQQRYEENSGLKPLANLMKKEIFPERTSQIYEPQYGTIQQGVTGYKNITTPATTIGDVVSLPAKASKFYSQIAGDIASFGVGAYYGVQGKRGDEAIARQSYNKTIYEPQYGTIQQGVTGYKNITTPAVSVETRKEQARKVGEIGTTLGFYVSPVGSIIFASEVEGQLRNYNYNVVEYTKENPLQAGLIGGVIIGAGALKGMSYLDTPIIKGTAKDYKLTTRFDEIFGKKIRISIKDGTNLWTRKVKIETLPSERYLSKTKNEIVMQGENKGVITFQRVIEDSGEKTLTKYKVVQKAPVMKETIIYSKKGKELLGVNVDKVERVYSKPPSVSTTFANLPVNMKKPFISKNAKMGISGKLGEPKFEIISGDKPIEISISDLLKLGSREKYLVAETLSKGKARGTPIRKEDIVKFVKEDEGLVIGNIVIVNPTKPVGKMISRQELFSVVKETGKINELRKFDILVGAKDVTKPYSRASGNIPITKFKGFELPTIDKTTKKSMIIKPADIKKTPLSQTFAKQVVKVVKTDSQPKIKISKPTTPEVKAKPSTELFPLVSASAYEGTGLYERTEEYSAPLQMKPISLNSLMDSKTLMDSKIDIKQNIKNIQEVSPRSEVKLLTDLKIRQEPKINARTKTEIKQEIKQEIMQKPILIPSLILGSATSQKINVRQKPIQRTSQKIDVRQKFIQRAKAKVRMMKLIEWKKKAIKGRVMKEAELIDIFIRRKGKDTKIKSVKDLKKAKNILEKELKGSLAASGFVSQGGKKLRVDLGREFRASKVDPLRVVQKRGKRLGTFGERKEIQKSRRKIKWF